jgi:hypothetical protein
VAVTVMQDLTTLLLMTVVLEGVSWEVGALLGERPRGADAWRSGWVLVGFEFCFDALLRCLALAHSVFFSVSVMQ